MINAFHVVNQSEIAVRFFVDERSGKLGGIRLTEDLFALREAVGYRALPVEVEARWRLVETAWELGLPRHVLAVTYDPADELLVVNAGRARRRAITRCRDAMNGYQKGRCFYCQADMALGEADIDGCATET